MSRPVDVEERVEVRIDALAAGGDGVGRDASGRVVFVPMTAPGDRVQVRLSERKERFARGRVEALLEPGPGRTTPRCSAFGRCGGCDWQHLSYPVQCRAKEAIARDALTRIGGLAAPPLRWFASPRIYGYRERARIAVTGKQVGFREGRSHKIAPVDQCPVLLPALDAALQDLVAAPPGDDADGGEAGTAADWELAVDREGAALATPLAGERAERELCIGDEVLTVSTGAFTQANPFLIEAWSRYICDAAGVGHRVLELFAGVGTLSLPLARRASSLVAVEGDRHASRHLQANLRAASLRARVVARRVTDRALAAWLTRHRPEVVVLDPPRIGLGKAAARALAAPGAKRVVYAACDPAPWARDLRVLCDGGFQIEAVAGFDFFPQSAHVETVAVLSRS